jgi:hypothetical protein
MRDIPTVAEAIERTVKEAEEIARNLVDMANGTVKVFTTDTPKPKVARTPRKTASKKKTKEL